MTIDEIQSKVRMNNFHNELNTDGIILDVIRLMCELGRLTEAYNVSNQEAQILVATNIALVSLQILNNVGCKAGETLEKAVLNGEPRYAEPGALPDFAKV